MEASMVLRVIWISMAACPTALGLSHEEDSIPFMPVGVPKNQCILSIGRALLVASCGINHKSMCLKCAYTYLSAFWYHIDI